MYKGTIAHLKFPYITTAVVFCFFSLFYGIVTAQEYQLRGYALEDGLPQSQVYDITQDEIGYLWLGTQGGGLSRFDGEQFITWNESDGLLSNYIHSLKFYNDSLFIGTKRGLSIKYKDSFINSEGPRVNKIFRFQHSTLLATNVGLYSYHADHGMQKLSLNADINTSIINDILYDGKRYWIATSKGLWTTTTLDKESKTLKKKVSKNFTALHRYGHKLYASAFNTGFFVFDLNSKYRLGLAIRQPLRINAISRQNTNELWMSSDNNGIYRVDPDTYNIIGNINRETGLGVSHIRKVANDRNGNIWIATSGAGFYKYYFNNFTHYNQQNGLKGNRVYAVHATDANIWASNSEAGLVKIDSLSVQSIPLEDELISTKIKTITSDSSGNIWAGTDGKGILIKELQQRDSIVIDSSNKKYPIIDTLVTTSFTTHILNKNSGLPSEWIRSIYARNDTVWVASYSSGIFRFTYDFDKKRIRRLKFFSTRNGIDDLLIRDLKADPSGKLWYATQNGQLGYLKGNRIKHFTNPLPQRVAISSILFHNNTMYLGTAGRGIWHGDLTADDLKFTKLKGVKNPFSNNIYQMIFDNDGNLWVGTERGVDKIILNKYNEIVDLYHYDRNDGFLGIETCLNAIDKDAEGNLWFGAIYGLSKYQLGQASKKITPPKLYFEDVEVAYKSVDSINWTRWQNESQVLQLKPTQTQLTLSYQTVDIDHPNEIEYRFRLDNAIWSPWTKENKQNLAGLAYGDHLFTAQSRNYRWKESKPISLQFFIDSPIYKKTWFIYSMLATAIVLISLWTLWYLSKLKQKNLAVQEKLQMQNHLLTLEHKALRLQMNPHFIFNVLNGIKAMGTSNPAKMNSTINSFATLLRETLYNSRKDYITLDQEIKTLKNYIEVEQLMASKPFLYQFHLEEEIDTEEVLIPPMLIQPFVENAIRHGILKGKQKGNLQLRFEIKNDFLHCTIIDNGVGIFQSNNSKTKTDHQSMALTVTRERLDSITGKGALKIKEIVLDDKSIGGTEISFKIPVTTDY
ncbi:two-component regulator propeller domain-containing protein [Aquimarina sp. 2-A2]|uniref:ligand-binding sensor domain-containing protein n=1 Tax=Aquimarina sp. 2-A2 TaxID=3382644 RepID=UPI00387F0154